MAKQTPAKGEPAKQVAIDLLRQAGEPLHAKEIAKRVIQSGRARLKGKTPEATITAMLAVGSKPGGPFKRVDKAPTRSPRARTASGKGKPKTGRAAPLEEARDGEAVRLGEAEAELGFNQREPLGGSRSSCTRGFAPVPAVQRGGRSRFASVGHMSARVRPAPSTATGCPACSRSSGVCAGRRDSAPPVWSRHPAAAQPKRLCVDVRAAPSQLAPVASSAGVTRSG